MDFIRKLFLHYHKKSLTLDPNENNNITTNKETSIDQCHSQVDNNYYKLDNKSDGTINNNKEKTKNNDSSIISINELGVTKILYSLENVAPIKISTNDDTNQEPNENVISLIDDALTEEARVLNNAVEINSLKNLIEHDPDINLSNNELKEILIPFKAEVLNDITYNTEADRINVKDDETMQSLQEFEEVLNNFDRTDLRDEFETEFLDTNVFNEIFDELDAVNKEDSVKNVSAYNESANDCKDTAITNLKNEIHSDLNENIDIISINSSTDDEKPQTEEIKDIIDLVSESDSDDGYNSSDFEFISEAEATVAGITINYGLENRHNLSQSSSEPLSCYSRQYFDNDDEKETSDPGEGPSKQNRPRNEFEDRSYRNDHHIPIGEDYLGLFQGIYNPLLPMSDIYFLENKSVRASAMNSQYDGIGFDKQLALRRHQPDSSEDEFEDEAKESAKIILSMYPRENRKRRRRHL